MTTNNINYIEPIFQIFIDKSLSKKQQEIAIRYAFGESTEEIAAYFNISPSGVRKNLDVVRGEFAASSTSSLRSTIFMRIIGVLIGISNQPSKDATEI